MTKEELINLKKHISELSEEEKKPNFVDPNQSKYDYLLECNNKYMNYNALSFEGKKITFEEMHDHINKFANALYSFGIRKGDYIGLCSMNTPEEVYLTYALDSIGAVTIGFNPFDNKKTKDDLEMTQPKIIITNDLFYNYFKEYEDKYNFSTILFSPFESTNDLKIKIPYKLMQLTKGNYKLSKKSYLNYLLKNANEKYEASKYGFGDLSDILFTGGSTGSHKGVDLSGSGLNSVVNGLKSIFDIEPGMISLGNIPTVHMAFGKMFMHFALCNNMEFALTLKVMPNDFYNELIRTEAHFAAGGPPHWTSLIEKHNGVYVPNSKLKRNSLTNLYYATSGGEATKESTIEAINEALYYCGADAKLGDGLGATEGWAPLFVGNGHRNPSNTLGKPLSTLDFKLVDPSTGEQVKKGEKGLLYISGNNVMLGYHNNPKENDRVFEVDQNGKKWCNIGDILQELPTGEYKYVGRIKRNFVSNVDNIYPEELEDLLGLLPGVREALVTPISDDIMQYVPRYHISLYDNNIDIKDFEQKLNDLVLSKLGPNWLPGSIDYTIEPLKRMANSKVDITYYIEKDKKDLEENRITHDELISLRLKR